MSGPGAADDLYQAELLRLARAAAGAGRLDAPHGSAMRDNPLCGDQVTVDVRLEEGRIAALAHRVRGCLLCGAAASVLGGTAPGRTAAEVREARDRLAALLAGAPPPAGPWEALAVFAPVRTVRSRHGCVLLPFDAAGEALAAAGAR